MCAHKHFPAIILDLIPDVYSMGRVLMSELLVVYNPQAVTRQNIQLQKGLLGTVGARHEAAVVLMG